LLGVLIVVWRPEGVTLSTGLWFVAAAAFSGSAGAVLMKLVVDVAPFRFPAWVYQQAASFFFISQLIEDGLFPDPCNISQTEGADIRCSEMSAIRS